MNQLFLNAFTVSSQAASEGVFQSLIAEAEEEVPNVLHVDLLRASLVEAGIPLKADVVRRFDRLQNSIAVPDGDPKKVGEALRALQKGISALPVPARQALRQRAFALATHDTERGLNAYYLKRALPTKLSPGLTRFDFVPAELAPIQTADELLDFQRTLGAALLERAELLSMMGVQLFRGVWDHKVSLPNVDSDIGTIDTEVVWPAVPSNLKDHIGMVIGTAVGDGIESSGILFGNVDEVNGVETSTGLWKRMEAGARFLYATGWTETRSPFLQIAYLSNHYKLVGGENGRRLPRLGMALLQTDYDADRKVSKLSINIVERGLDQDEITYRANPLLRATYHVQK